MLMCSTQPTWATELDDGRPADPQTDLAVRYLYAVYWSVTTLTTVGYGDITPTNWGERLFALCTMLVSAIVFGYLISNIGALVASMDRQAAKVEERLDSVKEYVKFRQLPKDLSTRVKKHYSFYFTQRSGFDEVELLQGLPPSLGSEVTKYVLKETLGRLPLFNHTTTDPEFQMEVFPLIKPVSYQPGEDIFKRGEPSLDLIFLLAGEVSVLSPMTNRVASKLTPTEEIVMSSEVPPQKVMELKHMGAFGSTVLTGRRRTMTHKATAVCQVLVLSKPDLKYLFEKNPRASKRIKDVLMAEVARKERMQVLYMRFVIGSLAGVNDPTSIAKRSCLIIQKAWKRFANTLVTADMIGEQDHGDEDVIATSANGRNSSVEMRNSMEHRKDSGGGALWHAHAAAKALPRKRKQRLLVQTENQINEVFADLKEKIDDHYAKRRS